MSRHIQDFIHFAEQHPELQFLVTAIGCGSAGFSPVQVAPLFADCVRLENVKLPLEFWKVLGLATN